MKTGLELKRISDENGYEESTRVIKKAFSTVANEFNLTKENAPTNAAFIEADALGMMQDKGIEMFGVYESDKQIGFVALEKANDSLYYMEKLAVLPEYRHKGTGKAILDFVLDYVENRNGTKISIGIVNENIRLKNWYSDYGFKETSIKKYEHLPFTVCFMEKLI
ncbi:MAG: GNAT family N-acetyltransferase [Bacillota bacterium]|nr:GNAT family N-acetyltransferase [Bacillota bacterium]